MAEITGTMVMSLRQKTGAGVSDCKNALVEAGGNEEQAVEILRKKGMATAAKKGGRVAEKFLRFLQVDDINAVALAENVFFHFRIPASNLMSEVNARFEQFLHCYCSQN